jgi:hypothetical protein
VRHARDSFKRIACGVPRAARLRGEAGRAARPLMLRSTVLDETKLPVEASAFPCISSPRPRRWPEAAALASATSRPERSPPSHFVPHSPRLPRQPSFVAWRPGNAVILKLQRKLADATIAALQAASLAC